MKAMILDMKDMSDSKEVYDSKPNIISIIFIYSILIMLTIALIWMYFGRIDVVVKSEGILRPNEQVSTIVNEYGGTLEEVKVTDGDTVLAGDILYVIEHKDLITERDYLENQINDTSKTIELLEKYKESIKADENLFQDIPEEEEYYTKFLSYHLNYKMTEKGIDFSEEERMLSLELVTKQLTNSRSEYTYINKLKESIKLGKNLFSKQGAELKYYNLYEKYKSDYKALNLQYDKREQEIDLSTTEQGVINSLEYYNEKIDGLKDLQQSVNDNTSYFTKQTSFSMEYENYKMKITELTSDYNQAKEDYEINLELKDYGVSEWEINQSKVVMEKADKSIKTYKTNFLAEIKAQIAELNKTIKELDLAKDNTLSKEMLYQANESERKSAVDNFSLEYVTQLDSKSSALNESIMNLEGNEESLTLQGEKAFVYDSLNGNAESGDLLYLKNTELQTTINEIQAYKDRQTELEKSFSKVEESIASSIVRAQINGTVNSGIELVKGNLLPTGTEVLDIIPDNDSKYKVNIYVSNGDIGKLEEGMEIKCNVYALPNKEYGYITGKVSKISKDIKVDSNNTTGYYLVEANLDHKALYDYSGKSAELKAGMGCQAQVITGNKNILTFILEKLDFLKS